MTKPLLRWLCMACSTTLLVACESLPITPDSQATTPNTAARLEPADEAGRQLLQWQEALRQAPADSLGVWTARIAAEPPSPANQMHLALVWLHTRTPADTARALTQLEAVQTATDPAALPWVDWARLLAARASEQKRLDEQLARQGQQLRESQRRIDQLTEQLGALKAIEQSLTPRRQTGKAP
jgi:hypothetical protein